MTEENLSYYIGTADKFMVLVYSLCLASRDDFGRSQDILWLSTGIADWWYTESQGAPFAR